MVTFADAQVDTAARRRIEPWTLGELARFLLDQREDAIKAIMPGLSSDVIACVVKLMSNDELIAVGRKVFNPLPGSNVGAKGYMGARTQPNSPTDDPEDIVMQVLDGWSYAVGDVVLGTNPVSSDVDQVAAIELALRDLLATFELEDVLPHCVLAHVDVQAQVEEKFPGSTALWFQSLAGVADANAVFDINVEKMRRHARDAHRALRPVLRDRPGRRRDQRPRQGLRHGDPRVAQVRLRAGAAGRSRAGARGGRRAGQAVGSPERRRRLHRTRGLPHEDAARARAASKTP